MYPQPESSIQERHRRAKKYAPRYGSKDKKREAKLLTSLMEMNTQAAFESFSGKFLSPGTLDSHEQYAEMTKVLHPEQKVEDWLRREDRPFAALEHSSQHYHTNTLTPTGYFAENLFKISPDIDCSFPFEMMLDDSEPWHLLDGDNINQKDDDNKLAHQLRELGIHEEQQMRRLLPRTEKIMDASEWKHPRGRIRKTPRTSAPIK